MAGVTAVCYYRTSSLSPKDRNSDSRPRQQQACHRYAQEHKMQIVGEYYDAGVSGTSTLHDRPEFMKMIGYMLDNGARTVLVENASRFARDLAVQLTGYDWLKQKDISIVPVDAPKHFIEDTPTAVLIRQVLGAVAQFAKTESVARMHHGRRKRIEETGWAGGPEQIPLVVKRTVQQIKAEYPELSLRDIASIMQADGYALYHPEAIKRMLHCKIPGDWDDSNKQ